MDSKIEGIQKAYDELMSCSELEEWCDRATRADWGGRKVYAELFPDSSYRFLLDSELGNLYVSPGIIIQIPYLDDSEWDEDPSLRYYDGCYEVLQDWYEKAMSDLMDQLKINEEI